MALLIVVAEATWGAIIYEGKSQSGKTNPIIAASVTDTNGVPLKNLKSSDFNINFLPAPNYNPKFLQGTIVSFEQQVPGVYVIALSSPAMPSVGERFLYSISVTSKIQGSKVPNQGQTVTALELPAGLGQ